jgi:hypothetical protein
MDIFGAITGAIATVAKIKELAEKTKNLELKEAIVTLREQLQDIRETSVTFREENEQLKAEVKRLSEPPSVEMKGGAYYKLDGGDGPFCTRCYDKDRIFVRLPSHKAGSYGLKQKRCCPECAAYHPD